MTPPSRHLVSTDDTCPVCGEKTLIEGEIIDVGFGPRCGVKGGPDHCDHCGYVEAGPDPTDLSLEHYQKCWREKIDPWSFLPAMDAGPLPECYAEWIARHGFDEPARSYGECRATSAAMARAFPELRMAHGKVMTGWGPRSHWWCVAEEQGDASLIVDPTASQFPGGAAWDYRPRWVGTVKESRSL